MTQLRIWRHLRQLRISGDTGDLYTGDAKGKGADTEGSGAGGPGTSSKCTAIDGNRQIVVVVVVVAINKYCVCVESEGGSSVSEQEHSAQAMGGPAQLTSALKGSAGLGWRVATTMLLCL